MRRVLAVALLTGLLVGTVGGATPAGQDLTTLLSYFLRDLYSGSLGTYAGITNITVATGGAIRTTTTNATTANISAYDVDGAAYVALATATAGNTPTLALTGLTYANFGLTAGATGYGIRDNAGSMEFKNSGGAWTAVATASNYWARTGTVLTPATAGDTIEGMTTITFTADVIGDAGSSLYVSKGLHVGGTSDAGDNNLLVDGTLTVSGAGPHDFTGVIDLDATTSSSTGVITKGGSRFLHNFALAGTDGSNTFLGVDAGNFTMTGSSGVQGSYNTGVGYSVLSGITTGAFNAGLGYLALSATTTGTTNSAVGMYSLLANTTGSNNSALGVYSGGGATTGSSGVFVGHEAGRFIADGTTPNATGGTSVFVGAGTKAGADGQANQIVIGYGAIGAGANKAVIGNSSVTDVYFGGAAAAAYVHGARYYIGASTAGCSGTPSASTYGIVTTCAGPEASPDALLAMIHQLQSEVAALRAMRQ